MTVVQTIVTIILLGLIAGCTPNEGNLVKSEAASQAQIEQVLDPATMASYKKNLPKFAYPELQRVIQSPQTFWYDHNTIIPAYQDTDGGISYGPYGAEPAPIGVRDNSSGRTIGIVDHLFDGEKFAFPFGSTAGADNSKNIIVANFINLPVENGKMKPIIYEHVVRGSNNELSHYRWFYPVGTMASELIYVKSSDGELYLSELRMRKRYKSGWATNVFRPFPSALSLSSAIQKRRPNWQQSPKLRAVITHLQNENTLQSKRLVSNHRRPGVQRKLAAAFNQEGALDVIPEIGDEALVKELLSQTTFTSTYNRAWKRGSNNLVTFAASTKESFSIVPQNYEAGIIAVNDQSCARCHAHTGMRLDKIDPVTAAYGAMWGEDNIFSFQPFETNKFYRAQPNDRGSHIVNFNRENRSIRQDFVQMGLIKKLDNSMFDGVNYTRIEPKNL